MKRTTAYATAAVLAAYGLLLGGVATAPTLVALVAEAQAQSSGGTSGGGTGARGGGPGTAPAGTLPGTSADGTVTSGTITSGPYSGTTTTVPNTPAPLPGDLNTTRPGAGVNPYPGTRPSPGTATGSTRPQGPGGVAEPGLGTPRGGDVPPAPGMGVNRFGQPCDKSGTPAPNANVPIC